MAYFIIPILIACLVLCEVLLSQWRHRESLIQILSQTDPLTNLYNRRSFNEKLSLIQNTHTQYAIILIDIDHFKMINDDFGHHIGDEALKAVAQLLSTLVRSSDIVARYGGEEFIIAMPETSLTIAREVAERCRLAIQNQTLETLTQKKINLTASFGVATSEDETQINKIIHHADQALYRAKAYGRNQVHFHSETNHG
ncbi:GGDEF domain-containing protein [Acinetobacter wuhouensis]|nr:GGDEF domain-containing protein [Acinetobacter wuhouensis]